MVLSALLTRLGDSFFAFLGNLLPMGTHARLPLGRIANDRGTKLLGVWRAIPAHLGCRLHSSACRSAQREYQWEQHHRSLHEILPERPRGHLGYAKYIFQDILGKFDC